MRHFRILAFIETAGSTRFAGAFLTTEDGEQLYGVLRSMGAKGAQFVRVTWWEQRRWSQFAGGCGLCHASVQGASKKHMKLWANQHVCEDLHEWPGVQPIEVGVG